MKSGGMAYEEGWRKYSRRDLYWRRVLVLLVVLSLLLVVLSVSKPFNGEVQLQRQRKEELRQSRMAVCLVGGARRFELTGPSIIDYILREYPNADLFLHSPMDDNAFKLAILKEAPRLASVRIFHPQPLPETQSHTRVLTAHNSPNGIQGLLQYFGLVEGCLTMILEYQEKHKLKYDWVVRTRVDGYWNGPLGPESFVPGKYVVPAGSSYGGLNDRLGVGDLASSRAALSRLSLVPSLDLAGFSELNSEGAFKAQLETSGVPYLRRPLPFCIVSDRKYDFPPSGYGVPVAALSSPGPLSGAKCRPCAPACRGSCVRRAMDSLAPGWSWTPWSNSSLLLCDAHRDWDSGWESLFDSLAGDARAKLRRRIARLNLDQCIHDFNLMKNRTSQWDAPPPLDICKLGMAPDPK